MTTFAPVSPMRYLDTYDAGNTDSSVQPGHQTANEEVFEVRVARRTRQPQVIDGFFASNLGLLRVSADFEKDS
jgi:hypothetical protein